MSEQTNSQGKPRLVLHNGGARKSDKPHKSVEKPRVKKSNPGGHQT